MAKAKPQRKAPTSTGASTNTPKPAATTGPVIDTNFAVMSAAAMIGKKAPPTGAAPRKESAAFKQMKDGLNHPSSSIDKLLEKTGGPSNKRSSTPFTQQNRQVGHNQTFGADASKSGVPRRTGG